MSDYESTLRHAITNQFINTCSRCLDGLEIPTRGRPDLSNVVEDVEEDLFDTDFHDDTE